MYYDKIDQPYECYIYFEKALFADPTDDDYFRLIATQILDAHVIRIDENTIIDVGAREAQLAAVPFLFFVLQRTQRTSTLNSILSVFQRSFNHLTSYLDPVKKYLRGEIESLPYDNLDLRPLRYCLNKIEDSMC